MTAKTLNVSELRTSDFSTEGVLWAGQFLLCIIEGALFAMLIAIYFYLRLSVDVWPPPGARSPDRILATLALIPLFASCVGSYWADEAAKKGERRGMILGMLLNLVLAASFLALRAVEWRRLNFTWASDVYGSIVWAILFLHTYDIVADLIVTAVLIIIVVRGEYGEKELVGVHVDSVLWYFLVAIWIPLYATMYWFPYFSGAYR